MDEKASIDSSVLLKKESTDGTSQSVKFAFTLIMDQDLELSVDLNAIKDGKPFELDWGKEEGWNVVLMMLSELKSYLEISRFVRMFSGEPA